jgi:hypothetical protein
MLTVALENKHSVADDDHVSTEVAKRWTNELSAMMKEMIPGVTKL